jgi:hypothetical protein
VVKTFGTGRSDIHTRPLADRFESFEYLDILGRVRTLGHKGSF